jgi:hypothetical protein
MISEEYRALNLELHQRNKNYGVTGHMYAKDVLKIAVIHDCKDVLDYGCGKQTLNMALPQLKVRGYDPALPGLDKEPSPADLVVCTDVLEHIEPEHLDAVLDHMKTLTKKCFFMTIATRPAQKTLADGRNAHLIQEGLSFWVPKLDSRFDVRMIESRNGEIKVYGVAHGTN